MRPKWFLLKKNDVKYNLNYKIFFYIKKKTWNEKNLIAGRCH